jgi:pre-mRNA-processing factor SLU7
MRADPNPDKAPNEKTFAGDNALRESGDEYDFWRRVTEHTVMEGEKGSSAHLQAAPTQAVMAHANFKEKKARLAAKTEAAVLEKYGDLSAAKPDEELLLPESEAYVEYDRTCAPCVLTRPGFVSGFWLCLGSLCCR